MVLFLDLTWLKQLQHGSPQKEEAQFSLFIYLFLAFLREFYLSGSYKDCCNMKVICLIEISSCLVKHTEVTQKYIS